MSMQDLDHAFDIIDSLLDGEQNQRKLHDLSQLHQILKCTKDRVDQSITFDSFAGAIDNEDCSGYLQVRFVVDSINLFSIAF